MFKICDIYMHIHIYNGILLCHKKNEIMPFAATWIDLEMIVLSEVTQAQTDTICYHLYLKFKMWHKYDINGFIYKTEMDWQA